jgi:acetyl-CoA acetyltransferase
LCSANCWKHERNRRDFGFDFCRTVSEKNPFVSGPLKRSDCSLVSDGAAALVLSTEPLQVSSARVGAVFNMGGSGVANYLSIMAST